MNDGFDDPNVIRFSDKRTKGIRAKKTFPLEKMIEICRTGRVPGRSSDVKACLARYGLRGEAGEIIPADILQRIRADLSYEHGVTSQALAPGAPKLSDLRSRAEVLQMTNNEKAGGQGLRDEMIILRPQPGRSLTLGTQEISLPPHTSLNIERSRALELDVPGLIVVENWEPFRDFERLDFPVPLEWRDFPLVFRGMKGWANPGATRRFLLDFKRPVVVFPDFDPVGLMIAKTTPGLHDILWPGRAGIVEKIALKRCDQDRFEKQVDMCRDVLATAEGDLADAWVTILTYRRAIMQEAFLR